jgi:hypothetical protein
MTPSPQRKTRIAQRNAPQRSAQRNVAPQYNAAPQRATRIAQRNAPQCSAQRNVAPQRESRSATRRSASRNATPRRSAQRESRSAAHCCRGLTLHRLCATIVRRGGAVW